MPQCVLVTGGAGFIGSHLVQALVGRGERVVVLDSLDPFYDVALKRQNLRDAASHAQNGRFRFVEMDIRDRAGVARLLGEERPDVVVHLAARAGVRPSIEDPVGYADVNATGTAVLLDAAARAGVRRMVLASSSSVYGNAPRVPFREDDHAIMPISPYAATKRACEMLAHAHWSLTGMPTACLRFFTVYGPRQRPDLAIGRFMRLLAAGEAVPMFGDGSSSRDYTFIDDIVSGVLASMERIDGAGFRVWNLGSDTPVRLDDLIDRIGGVVGRSARIERRETQAGDVERTWADLTRSRAELGYAPATPLDEGLAAQWAWVRGRGGG